MSTVPDPEAVIAAVKKRLDDDLGAAIDTINAAVTDGVTIEKPTGRIFDFVPPAETLVDFPTVGIGEVSNRVQDDTGWASTGVHEVALLVFVQADDQQTLVRKLRRTRLAVTRTIMQDRVLEDRADPTRNRAWGVVYRRDEPGPTLGDMQAEQVVSWMSWVRIVIECRSDSDWA